jgi:hypothetical protein
MYVYTMALEPISATHIINPSHRSVRVYVYPTIVARQRLDKDVTTATNTRNNRRIVGRVVLYAGRVISKKSRRLVPPRTSFYL